MTKEDILKIAKEVNLPYFWESGMPCNLEALKAFATLVEEKEREECSKRLEAVGCHHCAENIRRKGQE
jgi:hypothetical protein